MTNFRKTAIFNHLIGNKPVVLTSSEVEDQLKLIREEIQELETAIQDQDPEGVAKELADALVVIYGLAARIGLDADEAFSRVHDSNMTKFLDTIEQATHESETYAAKGVKTRITFRFTGGKGYFAVISACDQTDHNGRFWPEGKLLKPSTYQEPSMEGLVYGL